MTIRLTPEDEKLLQARLQSGEFKTVEDLIHDALASQAAENVWLLQRKDEINEKIARGLDQLDRGEGLSGAEARTKLAERKAGWLRRNRS